MSQHGGGSAEALDLTDEKRTAIQGAMKNINLGYMPQWAAVVPEQAWIKALKTTGTGKNSEGMVPNAGQPS